MGSAAHDPRFKHYPGYFGVSETPGCRAFRAFKRQFLASIGAAAGGIEIQSKTKSHEVVRLDIAHLAGEPFVRGGNQSVVVFLRNRPRGKGEWMEIGIRADSHQKAQELCDFLVKTAWPPRGASPPAPDPTAVAAVAAQVAVMTSMAAAAAAAASPAAAAAGADSQSGFFSMMSPRFSSLPPMSTAAAGADSAAIADNDVQFLDSLKMRLRVCKDIPSRTEVISSPSPTLINHRPIVVKTERDEEDRDATPPLYYPMSPPPRERSPSRPVRTLSAARMLQFNTPPRVPRVQQLQQPPPSPFLGAQSERCSSPFTMQRLLEEVVQQPLSSFGEMDAVPSAMENSPMDTSLFETPDPSPLVESPSMQQLVQLHESFPSTLQPLQQTCPPPDDDQKPQPTLTPFQSLLEQLQLLRSMQQQQQPAITAAGSTMDAPQDGASGNPSMGNFGGANNFGGFGGGGGANWNGGFNGGLGGGGGGSFGSPPPPPPPMLGRDDGEYARFAAEWKTLAARVELLPPEKRRLAVAVAESITNTMCRNDK